MNNKIILLLMFNAIKITKVFSYTTYGFYKGPNKIEQIPNQVPL